MVNKSCHQNFLYFKLDVVNQTFLPKNEVTCASISKQKSRSIGSYHQLTYHLLVKTNKIINIFGVTTKQNKEMSSLLVFDSKCNYFVQGIPQRKRLKRRLYEIILVTFTCKFSFLHFKNG